MKDLVPIVLASRPAFLVLAPVCVFLGVTSAIAEFGTIHRTHAVLATIGALFAHVGVNMLNEYSDFRSGLDLETIRTPFSGGSGALPNNPELARSVYRIGIAALAITTAIGSYFVAAIGWGILPLGLAGLLLISCYSTLITRHPLMCLVAPGLGFGLLVVVGSAYVVAEKIGLSSFTAGLVPFFLCNNLLLLNQFPDIKADRNVGRRSFPIVYGETAGAWAYAAGLFGSGAIIIIAVLGGVFPVTSLIALAALPPGLIAFRGALRNGSGVAQSPLTLASNVAVAVTMPVLLGFSLWIS